MKTKEMLQNNLPKKSRAKSIIKNILLSRQFMLIIVIIIMVSIIASRSDSFFTPANINGLLFYFSVYSIMAMGLLVLFISGGFDMSMGTHLSLIGVILGILLLNGLPVPLAIFLTLLVATFNGFIMGILVAKLRINAFVTTLGTLFIFRGLAFIIGINTKTAESFGTIPYFDNFPETFLRICGGKLFGIEYIFYYAVVILGIFYYLMKKNVFFRQNYFVGGNIYAARLAGIKVRLLTIFNFCLVGLMVGIATTLRASRIASHTSVAGSLTLGLIIVTAVILGGASLKGGGGSVSGTILSVILLVIIINFVNITDVKAEYSRIILGGILFFSILIDQIIKEWVGIFLKKFRRFRKMAR